MLSNSQGRIGVKASSLCALLAVVVFGGCTVVAAPPSAPTAPPPQATHPMTMLTGLSSNTDIVRRSQELGRPLLRMELATALVFDVPEPCTPGVQRKFGGAAESRLLNGVEDPRFFGGRVDPRRLGAAVDTRRLGGAAETRQLGFIGLSILCGPAANQNTIYVRGAPAGAVLMLVDGRTAMQTRALRAD